MIAEPYIDVRNGCIDWFTPGPVTPHHVPYADFEREKMVKLRWRFVEMRCGWGFYLTDALNSNVLLDYSMSDLEHDPESSRLLKRAEFLKAVCEKEGVEWLPKKFPPCPVHPLAHMDGQEYCHDCAAEASKSPKAEKCEVCGYTNESLGWFFHIHNCGRKPARDTYTKAEVDERFRALIDALHGGTFAEYGNIDHVTPALDEFRERFL